jgi:hypothetical protein
MVQKFQLILFFHKNDRFVFPAYAESQWGAEYFNCEIGLMPLILRSQHCRN